MVTQQQNSQNNILTIPQSEYYSSKADLVGPGEFVITDIDGDAYHGDTMEEAIANLSLSYSGLVPGDRIPDIRGLSVRYEIVTYLIGDSKRINARVRELNAERNAEKLAAKYSERLAAWQKSLNALNAEAGDYSQEGYNKRYDALMAQKPVVP